MTDWDEREWKDNAMIIAAHAGTGKTRFARTIFDSVDFVCVPYKECMTLWADRYWNMRQRRSLMRERLSFLSEAHNGIYPKRRLGCTEDRYRDCDMPPHVCDKRRVFHK